ncbi:hypothetical protein Purlil1_6629 [Purpureocillium lilacinum]|uniref:Uncharacterized protein n=1 Tax=Purpureocillium lilacinum TaxID=33203 RepID=A0ABR0BZC8_PURLI|nr:hypothetical protein Purlil1_6629 [Purpureocillium lilacinum]
MKASTIAFALLHGAASAAAGPEAEECKQAKSYLPSDKPQPLEKIRLFHDCVSPGSVPGIKTDDGKTLVIEATLVHSNPSQPAWKEIEARCNGSCKKCTDSGEQNRNIALSIKCELEQPQQQQQQQQDETHPLQYYVSKYNTGENQVQCTDDTEKQQMTCQVYETDNKEASLASFKEMTDGCNKRCNSCQATVLNRFGSRSDKRAGFNAGAFTCKKHMTHEGRPVWGQ